MDYTRITDRLKEQYHYPEDGARLIAEKLSHSHPEVQKAFWIWWEHGSIGELEVEGYNINRLMKEHDMNPIAALLTLDWLLRDPEKAKASLKRGHDRIR